MPLLVVEDTGPVETAKGSVRLVKGKWGEGVTGLLGVAAWGTVALIPVGIVFDTGLVVKGNYPNLGVALIAIAIGGLLLISALHLATREIFGVVLYRLEQGRFRRVGPCRTVQPTWQARLSRGRVIHMLGRVSRYA